VPQKGFARAPDARPSHWRPLAKEITEAIRGLEQATIPEAHYTEDTKGMIGMIIMPDKSISRLLTSMA
jgi:phage terminase large subunit-like protein